MSGGNKVKLQSSDNQIFEVDKLVACESQTLRLIMEDVNDLFIPIRLPSVSGKILSKVIEYCEYHVQAKKLSDEQKPAAEKPTEKEPNEEEPHAEKLDEEKRIKMEEWDADFMNVDKTTLCYLINAANDLDIKPLLNLTCQTVANLIGVLSREKIRNIFNIQNDFTPEEEDQAKKDIQWAFDL